jgi:signal transduction histidine kinase
MAHRRTSAVAVAVIERLGLAAAIGGAFVVSGAVVTTAYRAAPGPLLSVLAAAVVAFGAAPTRRFVRGLVNRIVHGGPASPAELVCQLSARVALGRDPVELLDEVSRLIRDGTGAASVSIWLRLDGAWKPVAGPGLEGATGSGPGTPSGTVLVPIRHEGQELGVVAINGAGPLGRHAERLVSDLARHTTVVTRTLYLRESLRRQLDMARGRHRQLVAGRRALVEVQDSERRRLERDIHDSCQQQATLIAARVGLASVLAATDPSTARSELRRAAADAERLASRLDRLTAAAPADVVADGVAAALTRELADLPVAIVVDDARTRPYPRDLDAALYFCAMEAVQNAIKHASARTVQIALSDVDGMIRLTVRDDGAGFGPAIDSVGTGLRNLRERLEPWSGTVAVRSSSRGSEVEIVAQGADRA